MPNDIKSAEKVISKYAYDMEGLTEEDCRQLKISDKKSHILMEALGWGAEGEIREEERGQLLQAGFTDVFIHELAGDNGLKALNQRIDWLGRYATKRVFGKTPKIRGALIQEIGEMGELAKQTLPSLLEALDDKNEFIRLAAVVALGKIKSPESITPLEKALKKWPPGASGVICDALVSIAMVLSPEETKTMIIPLLAESLRDQRSWQVRLSACRSLGELGPLAQPAVLILIEALHDPEWWVRQHSAWAIGKIGPEAHLAVDPMILALSEWPPERRRVLIVALTRIGPQAIPTLARRVGDHNEDWWVRESAIKILGELNAGEESAVMSLIGVLKDPDQRLKKAAREALLKLEMQSVPFLLEALGSTDPIFCGNVREILQIIIRDNEWDVPPLTTALTNSNAQIRQYSVALYNDMKQAGSEIIERKKGEVIPLLIDSLNNDEDRSVREESARTLGDLKASEAVPHLVSAFRDHPESREIIGTALVQIGAPSAEEVVNLIKEKTLATEAEEILLNLGPPAAVALAGALTTWSIRYHENIRQVLVKMGSHAAPVLIPYLNNPKQSVASEVQQILIDLGREAVPSLMETLADDNLDPLHPAVSATLLKMETDAIPALTSALSDPREGLRKRATEILNQIEEDVVPELVSSLQTKTQRKISASADYMGQMGPKAKTAVVPLIDSLSPSNQEANTSISEALNQIGPPAEDQLTALIERCQHPSPIVRREALLVLERMGTVAKPALPFLEERLEKETDPYLLEKINGIISKLKEN